jgi:aerobic C4-dicarboxylate transport protein
MAAMFIAQAYGVDLSIWQMATLLGVLMLTSKGAAGVTGSGFITLAATLAAFPMIPVEGMALILGVDRFMSEARAITNLIGNGVATVVISKMEDEFDPEGYVETEAEPETSSSSIETSIGVVANR